MKRAPLVLVVDDNEDNREIYAASLRHSGYAVEVACDGEEALTVARRLRPAIVVMDLGMPGMDGWDAIAALRAAPETRATYVIVVSGFADATSRKRARDVGCDEFLAKPCLPKALLERVSTVLAKKR
jgi:CheY-like chemotaxis protein